MNFSCSQLSIALRLEDRGCLLGRGQPFHKRSAGGRMTMNARALVFLSNTAEKRVEAL